MWEYIAVLLIGFWLGVAIFLYVSCYWLEEIFDLPPRTASPSSASSGHPSSGASGAHAQLKRLVARVVEEAAALPALARYAAEPASPSIDASTYEDLLATAILNKVIERYQTENGSGGRSSGIHSASASPTPSERSSPRSLHSLHSRPRDISPPLREEDELSDWEEGEATVSDDAMELPRRVPFPEFGGDIVHATDNEDRDFDEVSGSDIQAVDGTWEENWLFQKKKIKTIQSVPVPMLVPNSNTEYRALIGDRDADDTTDLSDNASDQEEETEYKSDVKRVLDSKHVIGGKPKIDEVLDFEPDSLNFIDVKEADKCNGEDKIIDAVNKEIENNNGKPNNVEQKEEKDSILLLGIDSGPLPKAEFALKEEIHRTLMNGNVEDYNEHFDAKMNGEAKDEVDSFNKGSLSTFSRHEREGEYEETVAKPVQRYADSLRRKHFEDEPQQIPTRDTDKDDLIPGSIAYRERKKWLNYVEMPNNPYSPEAIQKRLSAKSTSSLFDMLTTKSIDFEDDRSVQSEVMHRNGSLDHEMPEKDLVAKQNSLHLNVNDVTVNGNREKSPSPKILKDVLAEEVPQYKRYGRDYYIREAKVSSGGRRRRDELSETSSVTSSVNKSSSLDNFDSEFASPVSASSSLSELEASALHHSLSRVVLSPRHASPNFAINPIFENSDRPNENADENHTTNLNTRKEPDVREPSIPVCGDGVVENEDIVRLKIPIRPEITEDLFESYTDVRRSNTLRSEDLCLRSKRRPVLNFTFGGSLRLNKGFRTDLCTLLPVIHKKLVGLLIKQFNSIASNQQYATFASKNQSELETSTILPNNRTEIMIEYEDEQSLFSAKPVYVDDDTDKKFDELIQTAYALGTDKETTTPTPKSPLSPNLDNSYVSSSSLDDSIKIYNVQTGEIVKSKPDNVSPEYEATDGSDNNDCDKHISEDTVELSASDDEESFEIVDKDSLRDERLDLISEIEEILPQLPSVKELAKKFVSMENLNEPIKAQEHIRRLRIKENLMEKPSKTAYMHSLTARSISKEFREELRQSMATPLTIPGGSKEIPEGEEVTKESSRPGSPLPEPGTIKTKLAFFESLKSKFSSK